MPSGRFRNVLQLLPRKILRLKPFTSRERATATIETGVATYPRAESRFNRKTPSPIVIPLATFVIHQRIEDFAKQRSIKGLR